MSSASIQSNLVLHDGLQCLRGVTPAKPIAHEVKQGTRARSLGSFYWVAVKEINLSYYVGGTILITIYTHYGNLI